MNRPISVILSTFGPLHLIKSADFISKHVEIKVIQGWIPSWWNKWVLTIASKIVKRNLFKAFQRRTPNSLSGRNKSIGLAEFYLWGCKLLGVIPLKSSYNAAWIYGFLSKLYINKSAQIFHVRSGSGFGGAIEYARRKGLKVVIDHSIAHPSFMEQRLRSEYARNNTLFKLGTDNPFWAEIISECNKGDIVLVNSTFVKNTFIQNGFSPNKIKVVFLGVREDFFSLKQDYTIHKNTIKILFTGGFGFRKGAEYTLKALKQLEADGINYEFICVGNSNEANNLFSEINARNVIRINTVPQDELKQFLSESDIYLFPSLCEGCASSGMEAMAAGLPVIATIESGLPITDGIDGYIVKSKDVLAISNAIKILANDSHLRETIGKAAAKKIAENYTWDKYAESVFSIYTDLIQNNNDIR